MAYILVDDDDRVIAISDEHINEEKEIEVALPEDFDERPFKKCFYKDGQIVYDNTVYILVDETNRISELSEFHIDETRETAVELPEGFDVPNYQNYLYQNGEFVYSEKPVSAYIQITELKSNLASTDYIVTKMAEAKVVGRSLLNEDLERYNEILQQRQEWRDKINELEAQLDKTE